MSSFVCVNGAKPSLTITWRMRTGSGPSFRTCSWISPGFSTVRSTAGSPAARRSGSSPGASSSTNSPIATASTASGATPASHGGRRDRASGGRLHQSVTSKKPIQPSSANSLTWAWNMYLPGVREAQLEDAALALALDHGVGEVARLEARAGRVVVEEVGVDVERVEEVELERVHEVDPHELVAPHDDRPVQVLERDRVDRVDLVRAVEVGVEPVHHHHELVGLGPALLRVDDERAVEPLRDVLGERHRVAVVEVEAERRRVELVGGGLARRDVAGADARDAVHPRRVDAVEVDRVRVRARRSTNLIAQALALARAERGPGHAAVVGPGVVLHARRDLDLLLLGDQLPLAHAVHDRALVEVAQDRLRVEAVRPRIDHADRPGVQRVLHRRAAAVDVVPAAVPVLGERRRPTA